MLSRPCEAHDPRDERVVATMRARPRPREQPIETMRRRLAAALRHVKSQTPQPGGSHSHQQRRLALTALREIREPRAHELVTGKLGGNVDHAPIIGPRHPLARLQMITL